MTSSSDEEQKSDAFLPLGFVREEGGGIDLSAVKGVGGRCPNCEEGYLTTNISKSSSWGKPDSPATAYCKECNTSYTLGLKEQE